MNSASPSLNMTPTVLHPPIHHLARMLRHISLEDNDKILLINEFDMKSSVYDGDGDGNGGDGDNSDDNNDDKGEGEKGETNEEEKECSGDEGSRAKPREGF
ncbi:hypothetical protein L208DRAFT_1381532 [Tricholoma matsutake]|nr:hypothetical protein L208DRAFT_1381532 [Tricholoma matsutake 945]